MKSPFYLDTSAINYFADNFKDFKLNQALKEQCGFEFYLSPIGLWEILLTSDQQKRDKIIYWAQFNCSANLLKSPLDILLDFLERGCPSKERTLFWNDPYSNDGFASVWKDINQDIGKTIPLTDCLFNELKERTNVVRLLSKKLNKIIANMTDTSSEDYEKELFHKAMHSLLKELEIEGDISKENEILIKLSLIFGLFNICIGVDLFCSRLHIFWEGKGVKDPFERLDYLIENHPLLFTRGPLFMMANMASSQMKTDNNKSRGLLHDCWHTLYAYYAERLLTGDTHFYELGKEVDFEAFKRIILTNDISTIWKRTLKLYQEKSFQT